MSIITKFEAYLLTECRVSNNTFNAYKRDLNQFVHFLASQSIPLEKAVTQEIKNFLGFLKGQGLSARSMARKISALKSFFSYAHEHAGFEYIVEDISAPKLEKKLPTFLPEQEIEQLLHVTDQEQSDTGKRNKVMLYLLYVSGMRISELTQLKLSDIYFDTGHLKIFGKGGKERIVPLPQFMMDVLREYSETLHRAFTLGGKGERKTDYLFPIFYGGKVKPITRQACWIILKNLWKKTGIKKSISPHKLRHSLATHMLANGADLRSLQLLLGHEKLSTIQIYTHVETSHLRTVYDKKHPRSSD